MKRKPSLAVAVSLVALFFSLTGAGLAASRYIITSTHQIKPSVLRKMHGTRGPQGAPGQQGPQGIQGPAGQAATTDAPYFYVRHAGPDTLDTSTHTVTTVDAFCDPGDRLLSGGYDGQNVIVTASQPLSGNPITPWTVSAHLEQGATSGSLTSWVLCVRP